MSKVKSFQQKKETVKRNWHVVDVEGKVLGRIATEIASLLSCHKSTISREVLKYRYISFKGDDNPSICSTSGLSGKPRN